MDYTQLITRDNTNHDDSDTSRCFFFASVPTTLNMNHTVWTEIQTGRYHDAILDIIIISMQPILLFCVQSQMDQTE